METPILLPPLLGLTIHGNVIELENEERLSISFLFINTCFDEGIPRELTNSIYSFLLNVSLDTKTSHAVCGILFLSRISARSPFSPGSPCIILNTASGFNTLPLTLNEKFS